MSKGGKSFIALPSTMESRKGRHSKIVATLSPGTTVTTSRQDVQYVVTEYGCVNLKPLSMQDRARVLISLAHPDFRDELTDQAKELGLM
jgi:4-hydroxybutyrate CoA-transferase